MKKIVSCILLVAIVFGFSDFSLNSYAEEANRVNLISKEIVGYGITKYEFSDGKIVFDYLAL